MQLDPSPEHPDDLADELHSMVAERGPIAKVVVSPDGVARWANSRARLLLGDHIVGAAFATALAEHESDHLADALHLARTESRTTSPLLLRFHDPRGGTFAALASVFPLASSPNPHLLLTLQPRPIDRRRPARELDPRGVLAAEFTVNGTLIRANAELQAFFGLDRSPVGTSYDQLSDHATGLVGHSARTRQQILADLRDDFATSTPTPTSYLNGRVIEWSYTRVDDVDGSLLSVVATGKDVTERMQRAQAQRLTEQRFRSIIGNIGETVIVLATDGTVLETNATTRNALDHDAAFWERTRLIEVLHPDDRAAATVALQELIDGGMHSQRSVEARALDASGEYVWVEINGINLIDDASINGLLITVRNIHERRSAQQELEVALEVQQGMVDDRQRFLGAVSHELRNLVHGMLGLSEALDRHTLEPGSREITGMLRRQAGTLRRLVDDLLDYAMFSGAQVRFERERIDLAEMLHDLADTNRPSAQPGVGLYLLPVDESLGIVEGDPHRLRQALQNLITNALAHTTEGAITLAVTSGSRNDLVRVEVRDSGSGVDPNDHDRLFLPYVRGPRERSAGTGLGLTITKLAVELMGGTIGVLPRDDGATFWVELLRRDTAPDVERHDELPAGDEPFPPMKVLVVDDDPVNLLVATMQLDESVEQVRTVSTVDEAVEALRLEHFDLVICDLHLQEETAFDFLRASTGLTDGGTYITAMTGDTDPTVASQLLAAGAQSFLHKPASRLDMERVLRRAQAWLRLTHDASTPLPPND